MCLAVRKETEAVTAKCIIFMEENTVLLSFK